MLEWWPSLLRENVHWFHARTKRLLYKKQQRGTYLEKELRYHAALFSRIESIPLSFYDAEATIRARREPIKIIRGKAIRKWNKFRRRCGAPRNPRNSEIFTIFLGIGDALETLRLLRTFERFCANTPASRWRMVTSMREYTWRRTHAFCHLCE